MVRLPWRRDVHQTPTQQQAHINTETWGDRDAQVEVTQPKGFFTKVKLILLPCCTPMYISVTI